VRRVLDEEIGRGGRSRLWRKIQPREEQSMAGPVGPLARRRSSIKKEFSEKELQDLRTAFELLDRNQDGRITTDEFKLMLKNLGIDLKDETVEDLIRNASHVGKELLDENDFLRFVKRIQELRPPEEAASGDVDLVAAFRVFDLDHDGFITKDELRAAMDMIGEAVTDAQLQEFITLADTDKDGRINYEEFARLLS